MKNPKLFLFIFLIGVFVLLFIDLPIALNIGKVNIPVVNKEINLNLNSSQMNLALGPLNLSRDLSYRLGLDLQGGTSLTYQIDMKDVPVEDRENAFAGAANVIERRINFFGVVEPNIQSLKAGDEYRIIVELPGTTNVEQAIDLIGQTAQLSFWEEGDTPIASEEAALLPMGSTLIYQNKPIQTELTGKDLNSAKIVYGSADGTPQVQLNFTPKGAELFADITTRNVGKQVAIVIDNVVVQAPVVQQPILNGDAVISGGYTPEQAQTVAIQLNGGALPAPLELVSQTTVGPSLGIESLQKSLFGGAVGLISVVLFMILIYKKEGVVASLALVSYTLIVLFIFKLIPITLTLAGIAGLILSIGMAVDANILIFERTREELRLGKPMHVARNLGFSRAWPSIRDSNITSLIATFILFYFGTGIIRGFAVALFIGIVVSMFSAILVSRNLLAFFEKENQK